MSKRKDRDQQVAEALQRILESDADLATKALCQLMALTGTRESEARGARSEEIDIDAALWRVPSSRTKTRRPQVVLLSGPALAVIAEARERTGGIGLLFPSATGRPISLATLGKLLKSLGLSCVHSFRACYRTWMADQDVPDNVAELALGHTQPSDPTSIELLEQRRTVAEQWGDSLAENTDPAQPNPPPPSQDHGGGEEGGNRD